MMRPLAYQAMLRHNDCAAKTNAAGFGDLNTYGGHTATSAAFFRPFALVRLLWAGDCGDTFGYAGFRRCRFANLAFCPPTSFGDGERVHRTYGGRNAS